MNFGVAACAVLSLAWSAAGERWQWPEGASSVRIDTKVRFVDDEHEPHRALRPNSSDNRNSNVQADEVPFEPATDTEGFYNRPQGVGRYPVRVEAYRAAPYRVDGQGIYPVRSSHNKRPSYDSDGTLDSLQYCKCLSTPECNPRPESETACGSGKYLCCYKKPNKNNPQKTEFFNELDDERPMLFPGKDESRGPFPAPPNVELNGLFGPGHGHDTAILGSVDGPRDNQPQAVIGPYGPTGDIGPPKRVLVGPNGPTGQIGPAEENRQVLVGPDGPTGVIGPAPNNQNYNPNFRPDSTQDVGETAQRGVLVGPGGPTGRIGPYGQRPVLTGPGGPTGIIGPGRGGYNRGVLSGPGGPTGIIGPGYGRQSNPGILVGPGGPTGIIGPGRQLLVGPGGPTGQIGPRRYFGN